MTVRRRFSNSSSSSSSGKLNSGLVGIMQFLVPASLAQIKVITGERVCQVPRPRLLLFFFSFCSFLGGSAPPHFIYNCNGYNFGPAVALMMIILLGTWNLEHGKWSSVATPAFASVYRQWARRHPSWPPGGSPGPSGQQSMPLNNLNCLLDSLPSEVIYTKILNTFGVYFRTFSMFPTPTAALLCFPWHFGLISRGKHYIPHSNIHTYKHTYIHTYVCTCRTHLVKILFAIVFLALVAIKISCRCFPPRVPLPKLIWPKQGPAPSRCS